MLLAPLYSTIGHNSYHQSPSAICNTKVVETPADYIEIAVIKKDGPLYTFSAVLKAFLWTKGE